MRGRMNDAKSYAMPQMLNETMGGARWARWWSRAAAQFAVGDTVRGMLGWAEYGVSKARRHGQSRCASYSRCRPILGVVGMPGMTAWYGFNKIMEPKAGETVVVSAAAGAVGSVVGQLARNAGVRVVGIAGGPDKCRYVTARTGIRCLRRLQNGRRCQGVGGH